VLDAIAKGTLALPDYVPPPRTHAIQQTDAFIVGVFVLAVAPLISAFSFGQAGAAGASLQALANGAREMPTPDCFRDIGAIWRAPRRDRKARISATTGANRANRARGARSRAARALSHKKDEINAERQELVGVIWACGSLFGGVGAAALIF